jgi:hypothetical protein
MYAQAGLDAAGIVRKVLEALGKGEQDQVVRLAQDRSELTG